ncbi:hypothetical protein [Streptomyces sp. NRRL WC-3742]|uniref:hypothetical protein n=1 Tax=Streptomyces sp. NRRL WC-3742 TaxID=1463934 RepID=UPI0004C5ADAE|nr:hypothetical protein [Streptomyces sp. NRRL WC-3742]
MKKITAALGLAATLAASTIALAPSASAINCQENSLTTGGQGNVWDTAVKAADDCHDVNLVSAGAAGGVGYDGYMGMYKDGNGYWHSAASGYHWLNDGYYSLGSVVLISNLTAGRTFGVSEYKSLAGNVHVQH